MGGGSWSSTDWSTFKSANVTGKSQTQIFTSRSLHEDVDPRAFKNGIRESVDGDDHPETVPVAIFTDATGSMGHLAEIVVRKLDTICKELFNRKPLPDVHIMTGLVGDGYTDPAPIQATQFESDIRIADQTSKLWIGGCSGGGNGGESYAMPWLLMSEQVVSDAYDKRKRKGYIFTVGDEGIHGVPGGRGREFGVTMEQAERLLGLKIERDYTAEEILEMVSRKYHVFHIVVGGGVDGHYASDVKESFGRIMPDRLLYLEGGNVDLLPEIIVSTIEVNEGRNKAEVAASWGDGKSMVVAGAMRSIVNGNSGGDQQVVRL